MAVRIRTGHAPVIFRSTKAFIQLRFYIQTSNRSDLASVRLSKWNLAPFTRRFLNRPGILFSNYFASNASSPSCRQAAKGFFNIGHYTHVTERVSSAFCGDMTDQSRWIILFGHKFPGPSSGMLAYCNKSYPVGDATSAIETELRTFSVDGG